MEDAITKRVAERVDDALCVLKFKNLDKINNELNVCMFKDCKSERVVTWGEKIPRLGMNVYCTPHSRTLYTKEKELTEKFLEEEKKLEKEREKEKRRQEKEREKEEKRLEKEEKDRKKEREREEKDRRLKAYYDMIEKSQQHKMEMAELKIKNDQEKYKKKQEKEAQEAKEAQERQERQRIAQEEREARVRKKEEELAAKEEARRERNERKERELAIKEEARRERNERRERELAATEEARRQRKENKIAEASKPTALQSFKDKLDSYAKTYKLLNFDTPYYNFMSFEDYTNYTQTDLDQWGIKLFRRIYRNPLYPMNFSVIRLKDNLYAFKDGNWNFISWEEMWDRIYDAVSDALGVDTHNDLKEFNNYANLYRNNPALAKMAKNAIYQLLADDPFAGYEALSPQERQQIEKESQESMVADAARIRLRDERVHREEAERNKKARKEMEERLRRQRYEEAEARRIVQENNAIRKKKLQLDDTEEQCTTEENNTTNQQKKTIQVTLPSLETLIQAYGYA